MSLQPPIGQQLGERSRRRDIKSRVILTIIGLACTFFFLELAFRQLPLAAVTETLGTANPVYLGAAILAYAVNLALRAWRWQIILRSVEPIPYSTVTRALLVGYGLNTIIPVRLGEFFRVEDIKRSIGVSRTRGLTSIVIERLFDSIVVTVCLGTGLLLAAATRQKGGVLIDMLGMAGAVVGVMLLATLCLAGPPMSRLSVCFPRWSAQLRTVQQGLQILRTPRSVEIALLSLVIYLPDALSLWYVVKSLGFGLGVADTLVLVGAASLGALVPSGPASLGPLQFAYALTIEFAGAPPALGIAAATLVQLCILLPLAIIAAVIFVRGSGSGLLAILAKRHPECTVSS